MLSTLSFVEAIRESTDLMMCHDSTINILGLGVTYGADGTTAGLLAKYPGRVHDVPCSEAGINGTAVGMGLNKQRPLVHHGRNEFMMYGLHFAVTEAANWNFTFGGDYPCTVVWRVCLGRQWGNGAMHTRNHKGFFTVPGLKVVCPSSPQMACSLLRMALQDNGPVIYLEPRWLYKTRESVIFDLNWSLNGAQVLKRGRKITVVGMGDSVLDILKVQRLLPDLDMEIIDLVSIYPLDELTLRESVNKTGNLFVVETSTLAGSVAMDVIARMSLACHPEHMGVLGTREEPCATAPSLTADYYPTAVSIANGILDVLGYSATSYLPHNETFQELHLPPTDDFSKLLLELNGSN